jgi:hypothetical protein
MADPTDADFQAILAGIARELVARGLSYMVTGGQADLLHGKTRLYRNRYDSERAEERDACGFPDVSWESNVYGPSG